MRGASGEPGFLSDGNMRLLLFGGKGGVGKTTASAATALELALRHPERSLLLVSTDPAHSLQDSFSGNEPPPNLKVLELNAQAYLNDFQEKNRQRLREIASRGTFLDEEDINRFTELSLPGMDELMAFLEISRWVKEGAYDGIIMDTAPTGHTLRLMEMPDMIRKWLEALDALLAKHRYMKKLFRGSYERDDLDHFIEGLAASVKQMEKLLKDHRQCQFVPVMLAEALSIEETLDLIRELQRLRIGVVDVVINRLYPESPCLTCRHIRARQLQELAHIFKEPGFSKLRLWGVPIYPEEIRGMESLRSFWEGLGTDLKSVPSLSAPSPGEAPLSLPPVPARIDSPPPLPPQETAMLVFAGKGGVGKTTLACATALRLARAYTGKRILLFSADPAHSLADCLNMPLGPEPVQAAPGLWAMEMDATADFVALKNQYRKELAQFLTQLMPNLDLTFDREVMERIMDLSPPGIDELMALAAVMDFLTPKGYDLLVLDAAPTGHLIRLLELPEIIEGWLKAFFSLFLKYRKIFRLPGISQRLVRLSKDLKRLRAILRDPSQAALYAVSILTEMSFAETTDLVAACGRLEIPVPCLFFNMATPDGPDPLCHSLFQRESAVQEKFALTFPGISRPVVYRQSDPRGIENLDALGRILYQSADKGEQKGKSKDAVMERTLGSQKGSPPRKTSVAKVQHV
ncbi:MAG: TRC40/GET3/ArsA family transport-energizing ATPase, partial [Deltaproteobacteria bacterium]|nr:TRC40/GET3/ArsA family transport-energizing ATPase [Deltaproteobacteria bacterium]